MAEPPARRNDEFPPLDHRGNNPPPLNGPYPDQRLPYGRDDMRGRHRSESREQYDMRFRGPRGRSRSRSPRRGRGPADWDAGPRFDDARREPRPSSSSFPEPLVSYKVWMMRQTNESSPKVYTQRYEEYQKKHVQRVLRASLEQHKRDEWLQERYSPALRARVEKQKRTHQMKQSQAM